MGLCASAAGSSSTSVHEKLISKEPRLVITVTARLTQLQVISECVHELAAALWPAGSIGDSRPDIVGLLVCRLQGGRRAIVLIPTAGAVVITS